MHPTSGSATSGLIEGVNTAEAVTRHFKNTLNYIQGRKEGLGHDGQLATSVADGADSAAGRAAQLAALESAKLFENVDVAGPLLKLQ